jgi:hypothetical protein
MVQIDLFKGLLSHTHVPSDIIGLMMGFSNLDGGSASSLYLIGQNINGGSA